MFGASVSLSIHEWRVMHASAPPPLVSLYILPSASLHISILKYPNPKIHLNVQMVML